MTSAAVHIHHLLGCRPTPLAHYLKALGVLRLVGEQADLTARGWWEDETFHFITRLDRAALERFFLDIYKPTPLVAPWNGGSGFYAKDNTSAIVAIERSRGARFGEYRDTIAAARALVKNASEKPAPADKPALFAAARRTWRGPALAWLESVVVLTADGMPSYPPMLGTGGNDGRLDFTNNFMQRLSSLFDMGSPYGAALSAARASLESALFGSAGRVLEPAPVGMFLPGSGGGPNSGAGYEGRAAANPWDYVLMLEGAVCFSSGVTQRTRTDIAPSSPFAVPRMFSEGVGYATAAADANTRGEQWLPLWSAPATNRELQAILTEGRRQVGRLGAESSTDMARATARFGVARGISAFERYGYLERNGQAFVAVPLGRWLVREQPNQRLLDQIQRWVGALARAGRDDQAPASLSRASRLCQEALLSCCHNGLDARRWQNLLIVLGEAEQAMSRSQRFAADKRLRALPRLDPGWLEAADDGSPELLLATSLASLAFRSDRGGWDRRRTIRRYFVAIDAHDRIDGSADAPLGRSVDLERAAIALVGEALVESPNTGLFPLIPAPAGAAPLELVALFLDRRIDDSKVLALARPMMAIHWPSAAVRQRRSPARTSDVAHQTAYGVVRLAYSAWPADDGATTTAGTVDPSIFHRLRAGDIDGVSIAARRLRSAGKRPLTDFGIGSSSDARRLAAALAFGIDRFTTRRLESLVTARAARFEPEEVLS